MRRHALAASLPVALLTALAACSGPSRTPAAGGAAPTAAGEPGGAAGVAAKPSPAAGAVTISVVGTNDLHGALDRLPIFAGYVANLRAARAADRGAVLLVDGGDMFQGTLESNLTEGAAVIAAYGRIGYDAVTVGNHEFDFGPPGPAVTAVAAGDDPRGALKARAAEAKFPVLLANVDDAATHASPGWPNMPPSVLVEKAGISIGIIGVTTEATPFTTMAANFRGLEMAPLAARILAEADALRKRGAVVVVVAAHAGSRCDRLDDPNDLSSCLPDEEIFQVARALPAGTVDVIVAGHTHAPVAHRINDIAVIESYSNGRAFGRVDLRVNRNGVVTGSAIYQPRDLCQGGGDLVPAAKCQPGDYEGRPVVPDKAVTATVMPAIDAAASVRDEQLGVVIADPVWKAHASESPLGNLFCDLMLAARPGADIAMTNGGGLRADLPAGPLTYGALYQANPFDNRFAKVRLTGAQLRRLVTGNLFGSSGVFSFAGVRAVARCKGAELDVQIFDRKGRRIPDDKRLLMVTSDFLASGGDGAIGRLKLPETAIDLSDDQVIRDAMAAVLRKRGGTLSGKDPALYDPKKLRLDYPGQRPVSCGAPPQAPEQPD